MAEARAKRPRTIAPPRLLPTDESQNNLSKTTMTSPLDGNVIEVTRQVGERVRGSDFNEDVVMTLAALHLMEVKIEVGEHEVVHLKNRQKADIKIDAFGWTFEGVVVEIAQKALNTATRAPSKRRPASPSPLR